MKNKPQDMESIEKENPQVALLQTWNSALYIDRYSILLAKQMKGFSCIPHVYEELQMIFFYHKFSF